MKKLVFPILAWVLIGCQPPQTTPPAPVVTKDTPPVETPKSTPATTEPAKAPDTKDQKPAAPTAHPGDISQRLYQLRDLDKVTIKAPLRPIELWVMNTESKGAEGMMWLTEKDVKDNQGMIFVFANPGPQSFWMENTLLPLDITYIDAKGKVLNIVQGKPRDETSLPSAGDALYVIELKKGQAEKSGIKPGTILEIPKSVKAEG